MALYQPTFISPDMRGGVQNGVVALTGYNSSGSTVLLPLTISWRVNGIDDQISYRIIIYCKSHSGGSTLEQVYDSGVVTDVVPGIGVDIEDMDANRICSHVIPTTSTLHTYAARFPFETYYYTITLTSGNFLQPTEPIVTPQIAFTSVPQPYFEISNKVSTVTSKSYSFDWLAKYYSAFAMLRWTVANANSPDVLIYDTGTIGTTPGTVFNYDGFLNGNSYTVTAYAIDQYGREYTDSATFNVQYDVVEDTGGIVSVSPVCNSSAELVEWTNLTSIEGEVVGDDVTFENDGGVTVPEGSTIDWSITQSTEVSYSPPWTLIAKFKIPEYFSDNLGIIDLLDFGTLYNFETKTMYSNYIVYDVPLRRLHVTNFKSGDDGYDYTVNVPIGSTVTVIYSPTAIYIRADYLSGGLYPANTLYPSDTLYPKSDSEPQAITQTFSGTLHAGLTIEQVSVSGPAEYFFVQIMTGSPSTEIIQAAYADGTYAPSVADQPNTRFLTNFDQKSLNAGIAALDGHTIEGFDIYRTTQSGNLQLVASVDATVDSLYDYGVGNRTGAQSWYIFVRGEDQYLTSPYISTPTQVCFWDWTLLQCQKVQKNVFQVVNEFRFGKNLSSGSISNNNSPSLYPTFSRYPAVQRSTQRYQSGTLASLIGVVGLNGPGVYTDSIAMQEAISQLSTTSDALFLKNRKGDVLRVAISGPITFTFADNTREQAITASIPWAEIGSADGVSLYALENKAVNP